MIGKASGVMPDALLFAMRSRHLRGSMIRQLSREKLLIAVLIGIFRNIQDTLSQ